MGSKERILIVDDEPGIVESLTLTFEEDYEVLAATAPEDAIELLKTNEVAVVVADQRMPRITGVEVLKAARELRPDAVRIVLSGYTDIDDLITAINAGEVWRYLTKPWEPAELKITVNQAAERYALVRENQRLVKDLEAAHEKLKAEYESLRKAARDKYSFSEIVGKSQAMQKVFAMLEKVSDSTVTVLVLGETGTGKELVAKAIHFNSARRDRKFLAQNCGALTDSLLESELFGHKKGAFTGAVADKKGLFEEADGGTVFLDEIAETSPAMQVRLLRVVQEGEVKRVGENEQRKVDVRVIAATNKDLEQYVKEGKFREDLYYRLSVIPVRIPPLRERPDDVPLLAHHFLDRACRRFGRSVTRISEEAMRFLEAYAYPGNVRELENEIERAVMLAEGDILTPESLSSRVRESTAHEIAARAEGGSLMEAVDRLKRRMIQAALLAESGNKTRAAERIGLTRQSLQQMMRRLNME
ncbi:MAG TPA: sigma-54 dependent transcriptional regulator [bacterium]|nr:sigma-54 dependent transcriptional regulator [bacterium]